MSAPAEVEPPGALLSADDVRDHVDRLLADTPPDSTDTAAFLNAQFDRGLAWVTFPHGKGGLDAAPGLQRLVNERLAQAGAPLPRYITPIGYGMAAPTIVEYGTDEQAERFLRPLFVGAEQWCQLFSEPGAGSDLASLATSAVRDGETWVVNGQKVWTTLGYRADYGLLIARTDPNVPKRSGLTFFVCDMRAPGVEVRPLRILTGEAEFCEVFLSDVRIRDDQRIGRVGEGWRVATTTLMNERATIGGASKSPYGEVLEHALATWSHLPESARTAVWRDRLAALYCYGTALGFTERRFRAAQSGSMGPEGSVTKLMTANLAIAATEFAEDVLGADGMTYPTGFDFGYAEEAVTYTDPQQMFLRCRAARLGGGTSEVMRNIIGERLLGLPREPDVEAGLAWSKVARSSG